MNIENENQRLIKKNNKCIQTMIDLYNEKVELNEENTQLKEENKALLEGKNIWFDSHRKIVQERDKLSDELTSKIRHNHIQTLEINELKRELKEYRGF